MLVYTGASVGSGPGSGYRHPKGKGGNRGLIHKSNYIRGPLGVGY